MSKISGFLILTALLAIQPLQSQSAPVDVDGDGKVGPHEAIDLAQNWKGPASPTGGVQPWQINGTNVFYNGGNVGIGTSAPTSKLEIAGQNGLAITGFQPFLTLRDTNASNQRAAVQSAGGALLFYPDSFLGGSPAMILLNSSGTVGVGTVTPPATTKLNAVANAVGAQAIRGDAFNGNGVVGTSGRPGHGATAGVNSGHDGIGVFGEANDGFGARGVWGNASQGSGVFGSSNSAQGDFSAGVAGVNTAANGYGVIGEANTGASANGVWGRSTQGYGVFGQGEVGVFGVTSGQFGSAIRGQATPPSFAGFFQGDVAVTGEVSKGIGSTKIDHPIDPANMYLTHSSVESPDMLNIYNGTITSDAAGVGVVAMPPYFEAFNRDFHYQLTVIGDFAQAVVSKEIENNLFEIKTDKPQVKVSWLVTGVRKDAYAKANPIEVEKLKTEQERGKYLAPEVFGQPAEKGIFHSPVTNLDPHPATSSD